MINIIAVNDNIDPAIKNIAIIRPIISLVISCFDIKAYDKQVNKGFEGLTFGYL